MVKKSGRSNDQFTPHGSGMLRSLNSKIFEQKMTNSHHGSTTFSPGGEVENFKWTGGFKGSTGFRFKSPLD